MAANTAKALAALKKKDVSEITDMAELERHTQALVEAQKKADYWRDMEGQENETPETDQEGRPFMSASNGSTTFGMIDSSKNLEEAPIKLSEGNKAHGYVHMESRHGDQIRKQGYKSVQEFVEFVANNYTRIQEGVDEGGNSNGTYLLQAVDKHNNTVYIELSKDGGYWNVNSGGVFRKGYGNNLKTVWSASEVQNRKSASDNTLRSTSNTDQTVEPNRTVSNTVSGGKDKEKSPNSQENGGENAVQQPQQATIQPQQPVTRKQAKIYLGTVNQNIGRTFTFTSQSGVRSRLTIKHVDYKGNAVVTRQDYDLQGNASGSPRQERYSVMKVGEAIVGGVWF